MIRKILNAQDPRLRQKSKPVDKIDKKTQKLIADLVETLESQKDPEGVGLAAPQLGEFRKIFVMRYKGKLLSVINPEIVTKSRETNEPPKEQKEGEYIMEGCLSLPHYYGPVERSLSIELRYLGQDGTKKVKKFRGFPAQIIQHEVDHLNGVIFVDRLLRQKRPLYQLRDNEWQEVNLP
ncbi:MAG: peptide deformylase [Candidatus Blackburnbacteria bacterium]|nr:peptide deformylase [Candidatus Blackburnbacteria bacterium]